MIVINEDWVVDSDEYCYILKEDLHKQDKNGNKRYKVHGYFPGLGAALSALVKQDTRLMMSSGSYSLVQAVAALKKNEQKWEELFECLT